MLEVIKKHASNFTPKAGEGKKALQGICYYSDGSLAITDSHIMLYAKDVHDLNKDVVKHHKTGRVINESFPNMKSFLNRHFAVEFTIDTKEIYPSLEALKVSTLIDEDGTLKDDHTFKVYDDLGQYYLLTFSGTQTKFGPYHLKALNLYKCLSLFKDLHVYKLTVRMAGGYTPILISDELNQVSVLIAPVRRY